MAEVDTSIYRLQQPKSAFDYMQELAAAEDAKSSRERNKLAMLLLQGQVQDATQARDQRNRLQQAFQGLGGNASDEDVLKAYRSAGDVAGAAGYQESMLKRQGEQAKIAKDKADAEKTQLANLHAKVDRHLQGLAMVNSPQDAAAWLQEGAQNGIADPSRAQAQLAQLQTMNPAQFQAWKQQAMQGGMSLKDQIEQQWKAKEFGLKANNEIIRPDGSVNQPLVAAKQSIAKSGASNISVSTEKGLLGEVATGIGKDIVATSQGARDAQSTIDSVKRIRAALDSGKAVTGTGANQRLLLGQIGYTLGFGDAASAETLAQTRAAIQGLADLSLSGASAMRGQGQITENERKLLDKAKSGDITMTEPELRTLLGTFEKVAKYQVGRNAENVKVMKANPNAASIVPFLESNGATNASFDLSPNAIEAEAKRRGLK